MIPKKAVAGLVVLVALGAGALGVVRPFRQQTDPPIQPSPPSASLPASDQGTPRGEVTLDTRRQQLIGVRTVRVQRSGISPAIRAAGTVTYDETRQTDINTRVDGWIRDLHADYTGRLVRAGEPLFTLYSPDVIASQNEYLLALRSQSRAEPAARDNLPNYPDRLVAAARERLLRLEMTTEDIDRLQQSGRASDTLTFRSPVSGVIVEKAAVRGMRVMAGQMLYRVADLSTVWIEAEIYETDLAVVRIGARAAVTVPAYPDRSFAGRVTYLHPSVTEQTRTVRARIVLANPEGVLMPNMLATVELQLPRSNSLVLPADALVDTGTEHVVFVAEGDGRFTPRTVRIGRRASGEVEITSGLNEGDQVAASATFFLDSESQLRGALQNYQPADAARQAAATPGLDVAFHTEPAQPKPGKATAIVMVKDASGPPMTDAEVGVVLFMAAMPSMNMPALRAEATLLPAGAGTYRGTVEVMTPGRWDVTVTVRKAGHLLTTRQFALMAR